MGAWKLGIIGGSGLYEWEKLERPRWVNVASPWGEPSDEVLTGTLNGLNVAFLPRHGRGHRLLPHEVNARANIDVLKRLGCTDVIAVSAVGSLDEDLAPGSFAVARQYIDRTRQRPSSFFGAGVIAHVSMADPVCARLTEHILASGREAGIDVKDSAVYVAIEGPQFSTRAESQLYRQWGSHLIGMTSMPEARLAREAELPYANLCMVTDYDCWRGEAPADVPEILRVMRANVVRAKDLLAHLAANLPAERPASPIDSCLDTAVISPPENWSKAASDKLDAVLARFMRGR